MKGRKRFPLHYTSTYVLTVMKGRKIFLPHCATGHTSRSQRQTCLPRKQIQQAGHPLNTRCHKLHTGRSVTRGSTMGAARPFRPPAPAPDWCRSRSERSKRGSTTRPAAAWSGVSNTLTTRPRVDYNLPSSRICFNESSTAALIPPRLRTRHTGPAARARCTDSPDRASPPSKSQSIRCLKRSTTRPRTKGR